MSFHENNLSLIVNKKNKVNDILIYINRYSHFHHLLGLSVHTSQTTSHSPLTTNRNLEKARQPLHFPRGASRFFSWLWPRGSCELLSPHHRERTQRTASQRGFGVLAAQESRLLHRKRKITGTELPPLHNIHRRLAARGEARHVIKDTSRSARVLFPSPFI